MMEQQSQADSQFDPLGLRSSLWKQLEEGTAKLRCRSCENAKVIYIQKQKEEPPWDLWGRIFQWLGPAPSALGMQGAAPSALGMQGPAKEGKWRVFWFPADIKRQYPSVSEEVGPASLNGGYSYPCHNEMIVIYRLEEATRVLIHEILHASCCDPQGASLPMKEANTETWAELLLVAIVSKGSEREASRLWQLQSQWIANQNAILRDRYNVTEPSDYAWRYTLGREDVLASLKIDLPEAKDGRTHSSRLTSPAIYL